VELEIHRVNSDIDSTNIQINSIINEIADIDQLPKITAQIKQRRKELVRREEMLMEKEKQLRDEKKLLLEKEKQLRDEKKLLLEEKKQLREKEKLFLEKKIELESEQRNVATTGI
jgi:hypothetical protein